MRVGNAYLLLVLAATLAIIVVVENGGQGPQVDLHVARGRGPACRTDPKDPKSPLVCSHKGYHQPYDFPKRSTLYPPVPGSDLVKSVRWFVKYMRVRCFDLDLVVLSDGAIVVGHPRDIAARMRLGGLMNVTDLVLPTLHRRQAVAAMAPTLTTFLASIADANVEMITFEAKGFNEAAMVQVSGILGAHRRVAPEQKMHLLVSPGPAVPAGVTADTPLALSVREASHGGDESIFCSDNAPPRYRVLLPPMQVLAHCPNADPVRRGTRDAVAVWNVRTPDHVRALGGRATSVITDVPAGVAAHCGV